MTTPQFIARLDAKMAAFGNGKLVPPAKVLTDNLSETLEARLHRQITEQILRDARIEERVAAALQKIDLPPPEHLHAAVDHALAGEPAVSWRAAIERLAGEVLAGKERGDTSPESGP